MAGKEGIKAGSAYVLLGVDLTELQTKLGHAGKMVGDFGSNLKAIGAGFEKMGRMVTDPFLKGLETLRGWGAELFKGSQNTGIGVEKLGALAYATGTDVESMTAAIRHMNVFMLEAAEGSEKADRALARMGLTFEELNGLSTDQRLLRIADGLRSIANEGEASAVSTEVFSRRGQQMFAQMRQGSGSLQNRMNVAGQMGGVLSEADVKLAVAWNKETQLLAMADKGMWASLGAAAAPMMIEFYQILRGVVLTVKSFIDNNRALLDTIFRIADTVVTTGIVLGVLGGILFGVGKAIILIGPAVAAGWAAVTGIVAGVIGTVWAWLPTLLAVGAGAFVVWGVLKAFGTTLGAVWDGIGDIIGSVWDSLKEFFTGDVFKTFIGMAAVAIGAVIAPMVGLYYLVREVIDAISEWNSSTEESGGIMKDLISLTGELFGMALEGWKLFFEDAAELLSPITGAIDAMVPAFYRVGSEIYNVFASTFARIGDLVTDLVEQMKMMIGGIKDALRVGDWELAWNIIVASGMLAWNRLIQFFEQTWEDWKFAAEAVINEVSFFLGSVFRGAVTEVHVMFVKVWSEVKLAFLRAITSMAEMMAGNILTDPLGQWGVLASQMRLARTQEINQQVGAEQNIRNANADRLRQSAQAHGFAMAELDTARIVAGLERDNADNQGEVGYWQAMLESLTIEAQMLREQQDIALQVQLPGGGEEGMRGIHSTVLGTFSAEAIRGFSGGSDPAERSARANEEQVRQMQALREEIALLRQEVRPRAV